MKTSTSTNNIYKIKPGVKVTVEDIFECPMEANISDELKAFGNNRLEFKGVKVFKVSYFDHNSAGGATLGDEIPLTEQDGV